MYKICFFCFSFLLFFSFLQAADRPPSVVMPLQGYLGQDALAQNKKILADLQQAPPTTLIILLNSTAGELIPVLDLAKTIYELKKLKQLKVVVYIQDNALGPAAIFPFLADEIFSSLFVSWGDIPLGTENILPPNILRNRVRSLIDPSNPHAPLLDVLADAMADPSLQVVDDKGWKIGAASKVNGEKTISTPGQTLVINQNQLKELGLVQDVLSPEQFFSLHQMDTKMPENNQEPALKESSQAVEQKLQQFIHYSPQGENAIGYLYIGDHENSINQSTWLYVKQALEFYKQHPPIFIILELDTPGGEVFAAQKISDALKEMDTQWNVPVVAFINNWAISAGAMLTYSCRFITVVKDGSMGAAEPVYAGEGGKMEAASEKVNSALRADFANRAGFFGRNPLLAEAMVDKDLILVLRHGKILRLDNEGQMRLTGPDPDLVISPKGKLLTLNAEQMVDEGVADMLLPPTKLQPITDEEKEKGEWPAHKMLLFQAPFFSAIPQATVHAYKMDWKTQFFVFLASPLVSSLLFMGLVIGAYMELNNPGLSLPGSLAAICLFLIILSSFSLAIANWLELILLLAGLALILVELFVLPTFGLLGFVGILLFIVGLFGMLLPGISSVHFEYDTKTLNAAGAYFMQRLAWLCGALLLSLAIIAVLARYVLPSFSTFNRFVLSGNEQEASKGYISGEAPAQLPQPGTEGEVLATLRPAGKIRVKNQIFDAISAGDYIAAGEKVIVSRLDGSVIVVSRPNQEQT